MLPLLESVDVELWVNPHISIVAVVSVALPVTEADSLIAGWVFVPRRLGAFSQCLIGILVAQPTAWLPAPR